MHCRSSLYMWSLCLGLPVKFLRAASMLTSPSTVLLSALDLTISILCLSLLLEDCRSSERRVLLVYLYVCVSPQHVSLKALLCSATVATFFSLSLPLRPLVAVSVWACAFLPRFSGARCRSVCASETVCWLVSRCHNITAFWFCFTKALDSVGCVRNRIQIWLSKCLSDASVASL